MNKSIYTVAIWLFGATFSVLFCYLGYPYIGKSGEVIFYGPDSFYHAQRILLATQDLSQFYQLDPRSESWIVWPWGYDGLLSLINYVICHVNKACDPTALLVHFPPFMSVINSLLVLGIGHRLGLSNSNKFLLMCAYAFLPAIQNIHLAARIDHHMVEFCFWLSTLYVGLGCLDNKLRKDSGVLLGIIFGVATAFHNSLFIIQIPFLVCFGIAWILKKDVPFNVRGFIAALLISQFIVLLPSFAFQKFWFSFYYHSWFHLYVSFCSAVAILFLCKIPFSIRNLCILGAISLCLALPIFDQLLKGAGFISGSLDAYHEIPEVNPPLKNLASSIATYSYFLLIFPIIFLIYIFQNTNNFNMKHIEVDRIFYMSSLLFGVALLYLQERFVYYGIIFFPLTFLLVLQHIQNQYQALSTKISIAGLIAIAISYNPVYHNLYSKRPLGSNYAFELLEPLYMIVGQFCNKEPGKVLSHYSDGHFITYFSSCSVLINNMFITKEDFIKLEKSHSLLKMKPEEFTEHAKEFRYVFLRRADNISIQKPIAELEQANFGLRFELLVKKDYRFLKPLAVAADPFLKGADMAGLYEVIDRAP